MQMSCDGVVVKYGGALALDGVTATFQAGELSAVVGRNGAGKSTLLMALAGELHPTSGAVLCGSGDDVGASRRNCRVVPESGNVFADLTVFDNLRSGVPMMRRRESQQRIDWALAEFPVLARLVRRKAGDLSGGERQALAVARAALAFPPVLLVDELSLGLAPKTATDLVRALKDLSHRNKMTIIVAEQNWQVAASAAFLVYLELGRVRESGPPEQVTPRLIADREETSSIRAAQRMAPGPGRPTEPEG